MKPECSTSQGARPRSPRTIRASETPYATRPTYELGQPQRQPAGAQLGHRAEVEQERGARRGGRGGLGHPSSVDAIGLLLNSQSCDSGLHDAGHQRRLATATLVGRVRPRPAYAGLAEALRLLIGDGRIGLGVRLPSERELTDALGRLAHHRDPGLRRAARERLRRGPARLRHLHPGARAAGPAPTTGRCSPGPATTTRSTSTARRPRRRRASPRRTPRRRPSCRRTSAVTATSRPASRSSRPRSPRRTSAAGCRPHPSRSW